MGRKIARILGTFMSIVGFFLLLAVAVASLIGAFGVSMPLLFWVLYVLGLALILVGILSLAMSP